MSQIKKKKKRMFLYFALVSFLLINLCRFLLWIFVSLPNQHLDRLFLLISIQTLRQRLETFCSKQHGWLRIADVFKWVIQRKNGEKKNLEEINSFLFSTCHILLSPLTYQNTLVQYAFSQTQSKLACVSLTKTIFWAIVSFIA